MLKDVVLEYRARHGLTIAEMAERIGTTAPTIAKIERGEMPSRLVIAKVANLVGARYSDLVREEGSK